MQDPQSLHKYLYVHGDPINGYDPTGETFLGLSAASLGRISLATVAIGTYFLISSRVVEENNTHDRRIAAGLGGYDGTLDPDQANS